MMTKPQRVELRRTILIVPAPLTDNPASTREATHAEIVAAMDKFNRKQGKLRISLTHACQLRCQFCHQEGIEPHWTPTHIDEDHLEELMTAYTRLGGRYVELTGGEPLMHPRIASLLEIAGAAQRHVTLCTNGLLLERVLPQLRDGHVQLLKVSLHAPDTSDQSIKLLGRAWDFDRLSAGISAALELGTKVQLLYTLTETNVRGLEQVLDLALHWGVDMQLVDLIRSRTKDMRAQLGYLGPEIFERHLRPRATLLRTDFDRTGATLHIYRTSEGATWEMKDARYELFHSAMCDGCTLRSDCGEGVYALRVDATGRLKPCLLRQDLDVQRSNEPGAQRTMDSTIGSLICQMMAEH